MPVYRCCVGGCKYDSRYNRTFDTANTDDVTVKGRDIKNLLEIAQAMNDYFCSVGKYLHYKIKP